MAPQPLAGTTSDAERSLSGALIGGAFGFIGIAIFASASYADKVNSGSLWWGNVAATISVLMFVASIVFGGRGWNRSNAAGFTNLFNLQAVAGLFGIIALGMSAALFAFNPKTNEIESRIQVMNSRINALERAGVPHSSAPPKQLDAVKRHSNLDQKPSPTVN